MTYNERRGAGRKGLAKSILKPAGLAVFLGLSGASVVPQAVLAQSYAFRSVQIEGLERIDAASVMAHLGIASGQAISAAELNEGYQRLVAAGLFESVKIVPRGSVLVVKVTEYPSVNRINIEGNRAIKDASLLKLLNTRPRYVYNPAQVERDAQIITEAYQAQGRLAATVTPKIIRRSQNRVDVVFEVAEGANSEVERISFTGNRAFSDARLRRVVSSKQAGLLRWLVQSDTFDPGRLEFDKQLLRDFYASHGYADFQVRAVTSEVPAQEDGFFVSFQVVEGQKFTFGKVTTISEVEGVDAAAFERLNTVRAGTTYNPAVIERTIALMENKAAKMGYGFVRVDPRVTRDERAGKLNIEFAIVRGPRIVVERIDIEGNSTTLDRVVRGQFTTVEGDPFNPRAIRAAAERIRALGFFANVEVDARQGSAPDQVVVDVDVEEKGTGAFEIGATYAFGEGAGFFASLSESNFLGRGQYLKVGVSGGLDNQNYTLSFAEPALFGRDLRLGVDLFYAKGKHSSGLFETTDFGGKLSLEFPASELARFSGYVGFDGMEMSNYTGTSAIITAETARGLQYGATAGFGLTYDTRRNGLINPVNVYLRANAEVGGFGSDNRYFGVSGLANLTTNLFSDDITLSATVEGGAIFGFGGGAGTRITDRYFLGPNQLLGFAPRGVGPRDMAAADQDALGGNFFASARLEARFPIGLPEEYGIQGGLFAHAGSVWGLDNPGGVDDSFGLRASVGAAIHWDTPVGPLRFSYAIPVVKRGTDIEQRFGLTFSTGF
ncbi:MAG: outer membrane protein assembly factor BamA [Rhodobacterales bacterium]|nr:MAG: outer membrane protein assembly factor BamA [Rhodobacterales bacterium]